jgi:hypothetical protein
MLWTCEAISRRQSVGMQLSDRLTAAAAALDLYRGEVVRLVTDRYREDRARGLDPFARRLTDVEKQRIARESGALNAMSALVGGL